MFNSFVLLNKAWNVQPEEVIILHTKLRFSNMCEQQSSAEEFRKYILGRASVGIFAILIIVVLTFIMIFGSDNSIDTSF